MNKLDKLLKEQGIKPHNPLDEMFDNPMNQLDDLFETFANIFAPKPFHEDRLRKYNKDDETKDN